MHDPSTVAFEIRYPWFKTVGKGPTAWRYHPSMITVWHEDPMDFSGYSKEERENLRSDDSCDWWNRCERPFPKHIHPRFHFWHWRIQIHPLQHFKRWAWGRCCRCGKGFSWGYAPVSGSWDSKGPQWFRSEENVYHSDCSRPTMEGVFKEPA